MLQTRIGSGDLQGFQNLEGLFFAKGRERMICLCLETNP
tara:strand:+ start:567 stop:683 length:117 start_codon:yes stop_codon:yes gene_type:complete